MGNTCNKKSDNLIQETLIDKKFSKSDEENYREYFKLIGLKLRKFYDENQNNQFNLSLSLDRKDFNTIMTAKKIMINPTQKFIYWKDFLVEYLNKHSSKGHIWANDLME